MGCLVEVWAPGVRLVAGCFWNSTVRYVSLWSLFFTVLHYTWLLGYRLHYEQWLIWVCSFWTIYVSNSAAMWNCCNTIANWKYPCSLLWWQRNDYKLWEFPIILNQNSSRREKKIWRTNISFCCIYLTFFPDVFCWLRFIWHNFGDFFLTGSVKPIKVWVSVSRAAVWVRRRAISIDLLPFKAAIPDTLPARLYSVKMDVRFICLLLNC